MLDLGFGQQKRYGNAVYRCIAPSLVEKVAGGIKVFKKFLVRLGPEKRQISNLKIAPVVATIVSFRVVVRDKL